MTAGTSAGVRRTKGVDTLMGDPKKAVINLSLPLMFGMTVQTVYNLVDTVWVSGLGSDALSAVGFFFPLFFMMMAISGGLGIGGSSAISRRIGGKDKEGADNVALHMLVIMVLVSAVITIPAVIFSPDLFRLMGAGATTDLATSYGRVMFGGTLLVFFPPVATAILRGEGDTKRAMVAIVIGALLNVVLDPIFIYLPPFEMGVAGAAWATLVSLALSSGILAYWLFFKKDTFVSLKGAHLRYRWDILKDILRVGLPASLQQLSISLNMVALVLIVVKVGGTDGVAVFSSGWRITSFATIPLMGIASALSSITGAAFGKGDYRKLRTAYIYAIKVGLVMEMVYSVLVFLFPGPISFIFTWSRSSAHLAPDLVVFFRVTSLMHFSAAFGMLSSSVFQGIGKGLNSLIVSILRTIVFSIAACWLLGVILGLGLVGVWFGIALGNMMGSSIGYIWLNIHIKGLIKGKGRPSSG